MLKMRLGPNEALAELNKVSHATFRAAIRNHWRGDGKGHVVGQYTCWLFCWGKTGMGSDDAAQAARIAFDNIFTVSFDEFDSCVSHPWARWARYATTDIDMQLSAYLVI